MTSLTVHRLPRWLALLATAGFVGSLLPLALPLAQPANAADRDSSITVEWGTGNVVVGADAAVTTAQVKALQPDHAKNTSDGAGNDAGSGHWNDFKDLKVKVGQTRDLGDQVVTLTASGMNPTITSFSEGSSNFLQVFQCWGNPTGIDFVKTCQWGGFSSEEVGGNVLPATADVLGNNVNWVISRGGVPFRSVQGVESVPEAASGQVSASKGISRFFDSSSSNEQPFVPVGRNGVAQTNVVVQSAAAQPYLGCGDPAAAGERCWLVVVPRGTHSNSAKDGPVCGRAVVNNKYGGVTLYQTGQVLSPDCTLWDDRIVVPLDFENPYSTCPVGSAERRVVGSEFLSGAMSSWQSQLCRSGGAAFALTTNSGNLSRAQLLDGGVGLAAVSRAVTAESIGLADPAQLEGTDLRYAPIANTALAIGFVLDEEDGTVHRRIRLTPRLIAKLLTQSYWWDIPTRDAGTDETVSVSRASLKWLNVFDDEEWKALGNPANFRSNVRASWLVVGPQGDDAIQLLWKYVLADADAVAFLRGDPDPWGATVNPYYRPPGDKSAVGGGYELLKAPLDTFPKADQSVNVSAEQAAKDYGGKQVDSVGYLPYVSSFAANADRIAKGDSQRVSRSDPNSTKIWTSNGPELPANLQGRAILGPVTAASAVSYGLSTAELSLPLTSITSKTDVASAREFVAYSDASVSAAIAAQPAPSIDTIVSTDPGTLPPGAYPLASTVYAAVNLSSTTLNREARVDYAALLDYSAGSVRTGKRGGLPEGYVPLTPQQKSVSAALAADLRVSNEPNVTPVSLADASSSAAGARAAGNAVAAGADTSISPATTTASAPAAAAAKQTAASDRAGQAALGGALLAGAAGLVASPFLLRRRGRR